MNHKNRKMVIILVIAIAIAAAAGFALYTFLSPERITFYVFKDNYSVGTEVDDTMLTPVQCDANLVVAGGNANADSLFITGSNKDKVLKNAHNVLRMDVSAGMPLTSAMLSVNGGSSIEQTMDKSKVAVTIPVTSTTGVSNEITSGTKVNIYTTGLYEDSTTLLFQNMRVLSVNKNKKDILESVTVEATTDESLKLIHAVQNSSIYLGVVNESGYQSENGTPSYKPVVSSDGIN